MKLEQIGFYTLSDNRCQNSTPFSQMKRGEIIITEYCNFKCPYCRHLNPVIYRDCKVRQLNFDEIIKIIDWWSDNQPIENIRFSGGEPTLHKKIVEIIKYAANKQIKRIAVSTNGSAEFDLYEKMIAAGCNDFSISLDACCSETGDLMAGSIKGAFNKVVANIEKISKLAYVTVGVVLTPENIAECEKTIELAHNLGVADIRIISAAQWNQPIQLNIKQEILNKHPILNYRINNFKKGICVRGLTDKDSPICGLTYDDSVIAGKFHFPCVIYMREHGQPIGIVGPDMRKERAEWAETHNCLEDNICKNNCLDVCRDYNNKYREFHAPEI